MKLYILLLLAILSDGLIPQMNAADLPSKEFEINGKYLILPIINREGPDNKRRRSNILGVYVDGILVHRPGGYFAKSNEGIKYWSYLDMSEYLGKKAKIEVKGPGGAPILDMLEFSDEIRNLSPLYEEKGRQQFHFSQKRGWNNDCNGMVYSDGLYHLSWQCNPVGNNWGNMYWGHAVSKDLVHWEEWPHIIRVGGGGSNGVANIDIHPSMAIKKAFSGSACVDINNTLGKQKGNIKTILACFTDTGAGKHGADGKVPNGHCGESLAYSTDNGQTYTIVRDPNPLVSHKGRDPKLFWHEESKQWVIVTYDSGKPKEVNGVKGIYGKMAFYTSKDLKTFTFASHSEEVFHECPEFVELPVDGDPSKKLWMLFDAAPKYQLGTFDGKSFSSIFKGTRRTISGDLKAGQCFSNAPDGRAIAMVWSRVKNNKNLPFAQGFTLPLELTLRTAVDGPRCYANPVKELDSLHGAELLSVEGKALENSTETFEFKAPEGLLDIQLTFRPEANTGTVDMQFGSSMVQYDIGEKKFTIGKRNSIKVFDKDDGMLDVRVFVDQASVEVFGENGSIYYNESRPTIAEVIKSISVTGKGTIEKLKVYQMNSIWKK